LPYVYVIEAIINLNKIRIRELHDFERPVAYLAFQNAEINRDKKKRRKPYKPDEFYHYVDKESLDLPEPRYGAAAIALIEKGLFPAWALFAYNDLKVRADDALPPEFLCVQCEDALLLAPDIDGNTVSGMLIASNSCSGQVRDMKSPCGKNIKVRMPEINSSFEAKEEAELRILS